MNRISAAGLEVWQRMPTSVRASSPVAAVRRQIFDRFGVPAHADPGRGQRVITTVEELDEMLELLELAASRSDDALRKGFGTFRMEIDPGLPPDPFSSAYRDRVMELYEWLHGQPYDTANEDTVFDFDLAKRSPFPYMTGSCPTVGDHLISIGSVIRSLQLPSRRCKVLELGAGWGNLTLALAQMGHDVTAVDVSPNFVALLKERSSQLGAGVNVLQADYAGAVALAERFDAVVFFESFHHSTDHLGLLSDLHRVVAPGGCLYLAGEPVLAGFPQPWCLRMDGESLWAIRKQGWFELGFQPAYLDEALRRTGWIAEHVTCSDEPPVQIIRATSVG